MKTKSKLSLATFLTLGFIWGMISGFTSSIQVTKEQAIQRAEQFIIDNGYTHLPAKKSKLSYELFDSYEKDMDLVLKRRKNTLQVKAFCYGEDKDSWDIGFLFTRVDLNKLDATQRKGNLPGRAVIVSKDGKGIRMAHKDPLFSSFKKI
ncbi:MAG: hypothetical protein PHQ74_01435 [Crocinitomicaceae bacterium]|nr:hypothetical protein [Crocinitomicaceae bacterium]